MMPMCPRTLRVVLRSFAMTVLTAAMVLPAQTAPRRLSALPAGGEGRVALDNSVSSRLRSSERLGSLGGDTTLSSMALVLKPSADQEAALTDLLAQQQDPTSANYHQWLTPAEYGQRFGLADGDLAILQNWLTSNGFAVESVAPSRNRIVFSGTSSAVESAFRVSMQRYSRDGKTFFENSSAVQLPVSLAGVVSGVTGLSSYRLPAPQVKHAPVSPQAVAASSLAATPDYTTSTGKHYLVPWDFRQIYGSNTLINSGYDGTGIKIGVIGQSAVNTAQIAYFQQKTGQTVKQPTLVLVPNTSASATVSGDEGESELDIEYAGGSAPGATVLFIYTGCANATTGNCNNNGVFDAISYAITNNLAPILTLSYGGCEAGDASYALSTLEPLLRQANTQGQTISVSSGDAGAAECENSSTTKSATAGLAVSYPASSPYVVAVGGTTLNTDSSTYWSSSNNSFLGSAIGYMPEVAWNDTAAYGALSATGGGFSKIFAKPSWQAGTGVPADGHRDVPDVSFPANVSEHAYAMCGEGATCTSGSNGFTFGTDGGGVGGTSVSAPNFAATVAILEQANGGSALGNLNPSLYALAAGSSGSTIFHDITSGSNIVPCTVGSVDCTTGSLGYSAGPGYDQATGLGSLDAPSLLAGLRTLGGSSTLAKPTVSLTASSTAPLINTSLTFSTAVAGASGTPTGTASFTIDGTAAGSAITLASGAASYTLVGGFATSGTHTIVATYSGSSTYAAASATLTLTVSAGTGSITMTSSPSTLTVTSGSSGTEAIAITSNGFSGALSFKATLTSSSTSTFPYCLSITPVTLAAGATQTATLTVNTAGNCATTGITLAKTMRPAPSGNTSGREALLVFSAGLLGCIAMRRRLLPAALLVVAASVLGFGLSGCGGGGSSGSTTTTTGTSTGTGSASVKGTYGLQITATSSTYSTVSASTTFMLVVQ